MNLPLYLIVKKQQRRKALFGVNTMDEITKNLAENEPAEVYIQNHNVSKEFPETYMYLTTLTKKVVIERKRND